MKILFVITRADTVGGAQVHVRDLALALIQENHEVLVVTGLVGYYNQVLNAAGIKNIALPDFGRSINFLQDLKVLFELKKVIQSYRPDLVSTHSSKAGLLGRIACQFARVPCLFTAHGWAFTPGVSKSRQKLYQRIERMAEPWAAKVICVSEYDRQLGIQAGMSPHRLVTIHNGMPDIAAADLAHLDNGEPVKIVMVARFDQQKDHRTLIQALSTVTNYHLSLVGDGPTREDVEALVEKLNMQDKVSFCGFRSDIARCLAQAQIFVLISNWEGFPRTILEAMRAGLPIIATQVGGVAEAVLEGETGFCVGRKEVGTLRDRLTQLVNNAPLRAQMGMAGRQRYEDNFTFAKMYQQTLKIYENVLAERSAAK